MLSHHSPTLSSHTSTFQPTLWCYHLPAEQMVFQDSKASSHLCYYSVHTTAVNYLSFPHLTAAPLSSPPKPCGPLFWLCCVPVLTIKACWGRGKDNTYKYWPSCRHPGAQLDEDLPWWKTEDLPPLTPPSHPFINKSEYCIHEVKGSQERKGKKGSLIWNANGRKARKKVGGRWRSHGNGGIDDGRRRWVWSGAVQECFIRVGWG